VWWCGGVVEGARDYVCIPPRFARGVNGDKVRETYQFGRV
jgi:hypothetical protein